MLKRVVSIGIGLSMLLSMSAFAITSSTTTTYDTTATDGSVKISVTTSVTGASEGDKITYLVHKKGAALASLADTDIVYIDQKTAGSGGSVAPFTYKTASTNIGSTILVGGSALTSPVSDAMPGYVIIKNESGNEIAYGKIDSLSKSIGTDTLVKVTYTSTNIPVIDSISSVSTKDVNIGDIMFLSASDGFFISGSAIDSSAATIITVKTGSSIIDTLGANSTDYDGLTAISSYGKIVGDSSSTYGVVFSTNKDVIEALNNAAPNSIFTDDSEFTADFTSCVAFPALGKGLDGTFVVQLADSSFKPGTTYYTRVYKCENNTYSYGSVKSVTVK